MTTTTDKLNRIKARCHEEIDFAITWGENSIASQLAIAAMVERQPAIEGLLEGRHTAACKARTEEGIDDKRCTCWIKETLAAILAAWPEELLQ